MIAYFILIHRYPEQFKRLFKAIYHIDNVYAVHIDKRSDAVLNGDIKKFLAAYPNVTLLKSKNALWGGYSLVDAELRGIEALLKMSQQWKFFINLSGQDFPIKSQRHINQFLLNHPGKDFLKITNQRLNRPQTVDRFENYCFEFRGRIFRTPFKRRFIRAATPYIGNQWMITTRLFCEFLCESPEVKPFKRFYKHTFIADEGFFQTVMMNTSYRADIVNDDMRAIDWVPEGTVKLRPRTFVSRDAGFLMQSKHLFARKFDETVDSKILDLLETKIATV